MKKLFLSLTALFIAAAGFSQTCTPDGAYIGSAPGLYPHGPLGPTCELIAPKTIVSLTDTVITSPTTATLYITRMRINSVTGLPVGLTLSTDVIASADVNGPWGYWNNTGTVPNQTSALGCAYVTGNGGAWDAAVGGGPNSDGEYPLVFEVDAYITATNPSNLGALLGLPKWVSTISPSFGGGSFYILDTLVVPADYADISTTINGSATVDPSTAYTYSVPNDPNVTYNWSVSNGVINSGQGTNSVSVTFSGSGSVSVNLTDGGCSGTDTKNVTANPTGMDELAGINASIYPNPSNGIFSLKLESAEALNIRIMDVSGKVVRSEKLAGSTLYTIDMQNAPIGVYVMEIETNEGRSFKKLVKN